ncbi:MAG: anthranilate synthase component I [Deltaproteobacteria bacterium]|nr:anthranilate synthase component I [Deltaproteobacteria bacterium]
MSPSAAQFERLAEGVTHVPVWAELLADRDTPVTAFRKLHHGRYGCLLESAEGGERWGRYSYIATDPAAVVVARRRDVRVEWRDGAVDEHGNVDPFAFVRDLLARYRVAAPPGLPRLTGGLVGYVAYDAVRWIEKLESPPPDDLGMPDMVLLLVDTLAVFDNRQQRILLVSHADVTDESRREESRAEAERRIENLAARLDGPVAPLPVRFRPSQPRTAESTLRPEEFRAIVERAKEYIRAGDIIQVVLAQRFSHETTADPFDVYRCLRSINPSPYLTHLELGDFAVVSSSPEVLVRLEDGRMMVRPIAGTHPRAASPQEDDRLAEALLADPKERAEHVMLLDLGRNDVGRVALPGTVRVTEQFVIERYSHVMHIVSNVEGQVAPEFDAIDALRAAFPAGTLSGAPKVRAMEIIDELEPCRRGIYGGALGYFGFSGAMDMAITIRTALLANGRAYVQAGAGIVADSDPEYEHEECVRKARALLTAVAMAEDFAELRPEEPSA